MTAASRVARIVADAEALLAVIAYRDLPAGARILKPPPGSLAGGARGFSVGSGHSLATAHGCRPGAVAVQVDAAGLLREADALSPAHADIAAEAAVPVIEALAIHELAHALVAERDPPATPAEALAAVAASREGPAARGHGPRWAGAVVLLTRRSLKVRHPATRARRDELLRADIGRYGFDADAITEALGEIADDAAVRAVLPPGSALAERLEAASPPEAERQRVIDIRRATSPPADRVSHEVPL